MRHFLRFTFLLLFICSVAIAQKKKKNKDEKTEEKSLLTSSVVSGLKFRNIGPAFTSGRIADIQLTLSGDGSMAKRSYPTSPSVSDRVGSIVYGILETSSAPTETMQLSLKVAVEMFSDVYPRVKKLEETDIPGVEEKLDKAGAAFTPGRLPEWK